MRPHTWRPNNLVNFTELNGLASDRVGLATHYHGVISPGIEALLKTKEIIIYSCFGEALSIEELQSVLSRFKDQFVIILTVRKYPELPESGPGYMVVKIPSAYALYAEIIDYDKVIIEDKIFTKVFLSLNSRAQWTRHALAQFVINNNLQEKMFFSYRFSDSVGVGPQELYKQQTQDVGQTWFNKGLDLEYFYSLLPITTGLDDKAGFDGEEHRSIGNKEFYEKSFCSIVTETYIGQNHDPFFTEKIFKPIAFGHPFLVSSSAGALQFLRELGFQTFGDVFNESYDTVEDPQLRFEAMLEEVLRITSLDDSEIKSMYEKIIPTIKHNHNFFYNELPKIYNNDIQRIKNEIQNIIATK